jgi:hypothetical protein
MDMKIFVDTDADIRLARRIRRDTVERGRDVSSVLEQVLQLVLFCVFILILFLCFVNRFLSFYLSDFNFSTYII